MEDFNKMNTQDMVFTIRPKPGKDIFKNDMIDKRLLDKKNKLHAIQDKASALWYLKYERGDLPEALRDHKFTRFSILETAVKQYFGSRGYDVFLNEPEEDVKSSDA